MVSKMSAFSERVYEFCKKIPKGSVSTYGAISDALSSSPRAVGGALKRNPHAPKVPCHRVVKSDGSIGGFMGQTTGKEILAKIELLRKEGVTIKDGHVVGFDPVTSFS